MTIHNFYNKLTESERELVDDTLNFMFSASKSDKIKLNGADPAERAAEALAVFITESRPKLAVAPDFFTTKLPIPEITQAEEDAAFWGYVSKIVG